MVKIKDLDIESILEIDNFFSNFTAERLHQLDVLHEWFFSKFPDVENPLLKRYPEDPKQDLDGNGIFNSVNEYNAHYLYRVGVNSLITSFAKDVIDSTKSSGDFEISSEFIDRYDIMVRAFFNTLLRSNLGKIDKEQENKCEGE